MKTFKNFILEQSQNNHPGSFVWHGSPHHFNEFSTKNTAHTGEGGAAYGSGIYVSSERKVGEHYRDFDKKKKGKLYHVHMSTHPHHMIHWDKKVSEQHPPVKKALKKAMAASEFSASKDPFAKHVFHHMRAQHIKDGTHTRVEASAATSKFLEKHDVHGVTYKGDIHSDNPRNTINHVVFNQKHLKIRKTFDHKGKPT